MEEEEDEKEEDEEEEKEEKERTAGSGDPCNGGRQQQQRTCVITYANLFTFLLARTRALFLLESIIGRIHFYNKIAFFHCFFAFLAKIYQKNKQNIIRKSYIPDILIKGRKKLKKKIETSKRATN